MKSAQNAALQDLGVQGPIDSGACPWASIDLGQGVYEFKVMRINLRENWSTSIIRWPAGMQVPKHRHFGPVHAFTFKGRWHYKEYDWFATAGSYLVETAETEHSLVVDEDTEAMFTMFGGMVDLGPAGEVLGYHDAKTALDHYSGCLAELGLRVPDGVVVS